MAKRPMPRTVSASSVGATKMRATTSLAAPSPAACTIGATVFTSSAASQLMMAPSPSRPGQLQHPLPQGGDEDRHRLLRGDARA